MHTSTDRGKHVSHSLRYLFLTCVLEGNAKSNCPYSLCGDSNFWIDRQGFFQELGRQEVSFVAPSERNYRKILWVLCHGFTRGKIGDQFHVCSSLELLKFWLVSSNLNGDSSVWICIKKEADRVHEHLDAKDAFQVMLECYTSFQLHMLTSLQFSAEDHFYTSATHLWSFDLSSETPASTGASCWKRNNIFHRCINQQEEGEAHFITITASAASSNEEFLHASEESVKGKSQNQHLSPRTLSISGKPEESTRDWTTRAGDHTDYIVLPIRT